MARTSEQLEARKSRTDGVDWPVRAPPNHEGASGTEVRAAEAGMSPTIGRRVKLMTDCVTALASSSRLTSSM